MSVLSPEFPNSSIEFRHGSTDNLVPGLPAGAYTEQKFLDLENERLFPDTWAFAGFVHELAEGGDVIPVTVGKMPILLVRDDDGDIRAFHNVCSHRCAVLVQSAGNVGRHIKCPYHAWVYGLDGGLRGAPHFGGPRIQFPAGVDAVHLGLKAVRSAVWHDWIFVNANDHAPPFEVYAAPLIERMQGIDFRKMKPVATLDFGEINANWKFLMENFIEPYHVQFVHRTTTDQPLLDHFTIVDGRCLGSGVDLSGRRRRACTEALGVDSRYLTLFPNFVLGWYFPDQIGVHQNVPVSPGKTRQRRVIYHYGDEDLSDDAIADLSALWRKVHQEDHEICERMQAGRASPVAEAGGVLSPHWEDGVGAFQKLVADSLSADKRRLTPCRSE